MAAMRARCEQRGLRSVAHEAGVDVGTLAKIRAGQRRMSQVTLAKLEALLFR
jgi:transcriptional regulator with XRE-family HTH domain